MGNLRAFGGCGHRMMQENAAWQGGKRDRSGRSGVWLDRQLDLLWSAARVDNVRTRDFTVNSILFDPFAALLFDYADGFRDCGRRVLRTVVDPEESFREDPARLLRAVRHAGRVGEPHLEAALGHLDSTGARVNPKRNSF
jgi:hypothetical protein